MKRVAFQYRDSQGEIRLVEYSTLALYMCQKQYYANRDAFKHKDEWGGFRPK